jgi:hypothetical protein
MTFTEWLEAVYSAIHAKLGGDPYQQGKSERTYGAGRFIDAAAEKPGGDFGERVFSIRRLDRLGLPTLQVKVIEWYALADAGRVAAQLVEVYDELGRDNV